MYHLELCDIDVTVDSAYNIIMHAVQTEIQDYLIQASLCIYSALQSNVVYARACLPTL